MNILFGTDIHESENALEWLIESATVVDALVIGGDITTNGRLPFVNKFFRSLQGIRTKVFLVLGNHDPANVTKVPGIAILHATQVVFRSFVFGGLGGSNFTVAKGPFEYSDEEAKKLLSRLGYVDILVSHCPPFGTKCDFAVDDGKNYGSRPLREYLEEKKPRLVLSGHVHMARAVDKLGETIIVNPGPLMEGKYALIKISKNTLNAELMQVPIATDDS
jgi:uncharacterized protein